MSQLGNKGYREYTKERKGRSYRTRSLILTNLRMMMGLKRNYIVIFVALFFLFFTVINIGTSQPIEDAMVELMEYRGPGSFFELRPLEQEDLEIETFLGEEITLSYEIENIGNESGIPFFLFYTPNRIWSFEMEQPQKELGPGESMVLDVVVTIPDTFDDFGVLAPPTIIEALENSSIDLVIPPELWKGLSENARDLLNLLSNNIQDPVTRFLDSKMYDRRSGRLVMLYCIPTDVVNSISEGFLDYNLLDPRITSLTNLVQIDMEDDSQYIFTEDRPPSGHQDALSIITYGDGSDPIKVESGMSQFIMIEVELQNNAGYHIEVDVEALLMPVADEGWGIRIFPNPSDPWTIGPGESILISLEIETGFSNAEKPYNIVVLVTDESENLYWNSEISQIIVQIEDDREDVDIKEEYFDTMWGQGINYMRFLMLILLAAVAGSTLISKDLKNNTITLYLSKPITWLDYVVGKWVSLFLILTSVTIFPAIILFATEMAFLNEGLVFIIRNLWLLTSAVFCYMVALSVFTSVAITFSALSNRWMVAGVGIFSFFLITPIFSDMLVSMFDSDHLKLININIVMRHAFTPLFGLEYNSEVIGYPVILPWMVLLGIIGICFGTIMFRFRGREVAK